MDFKNHNILVFRRSFIFEFIVCTPLVANIQKISRREMSFLTRVSQVLAPKNLNKSSDILQKKTFLHNTTDKDISKNIFRVVIYKPEVVYSNGLPISLHDRVHMKIQNVCTGEIFAIFTSAKALNNMFHGFKISPIKVNGTFIPLTDKVTKQPYSDSFGDWIPSPTKGGQYAFLFKRIRIVSEELLIEDRAGTEYCKQHFPEILKLYKASQGNNKVIVLVSKEDPSLYHENGLPVFDSNGKEIDYEITY